MRTTWILLVGLRVSCWDNDDTGTDTKIDTDSVYRDGL